MSAAQVTDQNRGGQLMDTAIYYTVAAVVFIFFLAAFVPGEW